MEENMVGKSVQLATVENEEMLQGKQLPPTPYAPEPHTEVHIAFINSPKMANEGRESQILAIITRHIAGEIQAQQQRQSQTPGQVNQALGQPGQPPPQGYKPPSGPTSPVMPNQTEGNQAMPANAEVQQGANNMAAAMGGE